MRPKSIILLVLALGCGLVASIGISEIIDSRGTSAGAVTETEPILVAKLDIDRNSLMSADNLKLEEWPKDKIPSDVIRDLAEVEGRRPVIKINAGMPLLKSMVGGGEGARAAEDIPKGFRVVTVRVTDTDGGNLILPGDRVDLQVYVRRNLSIGIKSTGTFTFLQDVSVFAVNNVISTEASEESQSIQARTISLLVTPQQAAKITVAAETGKIKLVMRGSQDDLAAEETEATVSDIFGTEKFGEEGSAGAAENIADAKSALLEWMEQQKKEFQASLQQAGGTASAPQFDADVPKMVVGAGTDWNVFEFRPGEPLPQAGGGSPSRGEIQEQPSREPTEKQQRSGEGETNLLEELKFSAED